MANRRMVMVVVVSSLILSSLVGALSLPVGAEEALYHTVRWGETLSGIARRYGLTIAELQEANSISNPNLIYAGQRLLIPVPADEYVVHTVVAGETLLVISAKYAVTVWDIALRNGLANPNLIYVGQKLSIPGGGQEEPEPQPPPPDVQEAIIISSPASSSDASTPVSVTGWGSAFENTLAVDILNKEGKTIGQGYAMVDAEFGQYGPFAGTMEFTAPASAQRGRIQVYSISPRDGAIEHLSSVVINLLYTTGEGEEELAPVPPAPEVQEAIVITSPAPNSDVSSPVTITGWGSSSENTLAVDILNETGHAIGQGYVIVDAEFGQYGPFTGTVEFTAPGSAQLGRIQVYTISLLDDAIEHLSSVDVNLQP